MREMKYYLESLRWLRKRGRMRNGRTVAACGEDFAHEKGKLL